MTWCNLMWRLDVTNHFSCHPRNIKNTRNISCLALQARGILRVEQQQRRGGRERQRERQRGRRHLRNNERMDGELALVLPAAEQPGLLRWVRVGGILCRGWLALFAFPCMGFCFSCISSYLLRIQSLENTLSREYSLHSILSLESTENTLCIEYSLQWVLSAENTISNEYYLQIMLSTENTLYRE